MKTILALDLASTTGWAYGRPGTSPAYGSIRFAAVGASHEAIFAAAAKWMSDMCDARAPDIVCWEAPLATVFKRGATNAATTALLYGLPAVIGAAAYLSGIYNLVKADTRDVRLHFIGSNPKRAKAKSMVIKQCRAMGWDPQDDNEADGLATWHYTCSLIEPALALQPTPLFQRRR
jgi:hypothetical protein